MPITRPAGTSTETALVLVDATSGAGGLRVDLNECDVYYFAPQKCLAADGGLWLAAVSPAAVERIEQIAASGRWIPAFFDLKTAVEQSRLDQTYNTPALATVLLAREQVDWLCSNGGLEWAASRCDRSAEIIYGWADAHELATPFVTDTAQRSHVVATIDLDTSVDANVVSGVLRTNGIVDTDSYRKLGRNQLRIALFPAIEPSDVEQLTKSIDHVLTQLTA
jgi:phosphoserine aminotransferase